MDEPNMPPWVAAPIGSVLPVLSSYFAIDSLSIGGGTILQARWNHRISTDIDLFANRPIFLSIIGESSEELEAELYQVPRLDASRSFVDANVIYCEIDGIELTVLPSDLNSIEDSGRFFPSTELKTESTSTILHKKILGRMIGDAAFEVRDLFDVYTALNVDRESLHKALRPIPQRSLNSISAMLEVLPDDWLEQSTKPLKGVDELPKMRLLIEVLQRAFAVPK